ncbi:MAG TPA: hypothetical protein PLL62_00935 [Candidatus Saccharicenans sp.]|nr:hypothetical protein [Candidatus Saccharicenans sp.]HQM73784.1 hypothetical protein [Candidatus Saccharicenans sp.]
MDKENLKITAITAEDLAVIEQELTRTNRPLTTAELAEKLAFAKTASERHQAVKIYDPNARYEIGDFIYKEYDENLQVGSKATEHFQGGVVLKVINKTRLPNFPYEMLEVDYDGGGPFRRYLDYMKKTKTEVLLPSNPEGQGKEPEILGEERDPRQTELPMTEKDIKALERNLRKALTGSAAFFSWNDFWQLSSKRIEIPEEKIKEISEELAASKTSISSEEIVKKYFGLEPSSDLFELYCLSLNFLLEKKYRKDFTCLSTRNWGKWHLKSVLNKLPEGLPISSPLAPVPDLGQGEGLQYTRVDSFPFKVYLTWREILSGAVRLPRSLSREFTSREYQFVDDEDGKSYTVYYYPEGNFLLGLAEYFQANNIPQGTSLTINRKTEDTFTFWIKKSKKKTATYQLEYDSATGHFSLGHGEVFTLAMANKSLNLDREIVAHLLTRQDESQDLDLRQLLVKVFKTPELTGNNRSLHFLRAYHLVDLLRATTAEDVEYVLNNAPEFVASEKKEGIYIYQESLEPKEVPVEEEKVVSSFLESLAEQLAGSRAEAETTMSQESAAPEKQEGAGVEEVAEEIQAETVAPPTQEAEIKVTLEPVKKEKAREVEKEGKPGKKKKESTEDKKFKSKKSDRRLIEERIVEEESEIEALEAVKAQQEETEEAEAEDKTIQIELEAAKQEAKFGFFAEMLKSALTKKQPEQKEEEKEEKK